MNFYDYVIERKLPNGAWQKVTGSMSAKSESEVRAILTRQEISPIRIIAIIKK